MYSLDDTIAAISTPLGEGGIGIVRLSGPDSLAILHKVFVRPASRASPLPPRFLHYGHIVDPESNQVLDEVLAVSLPAPRTYTRQDMAEIHAHGGIVPLQRILQLVLRCGARLAQPGEMTLRAFLNGRIDLAQAEAVLDVVRAKTEASLRVALNQLGGQLSQQVRAARAALIQVLAYLTATIDFAEDDIPPQDIGPSLDEVGARLERLLASAEQGLIYRQGVRAAIVGRPNVGKSSLLNALLRANRAIVTPIPGTTRDTLEETVNLRGIPLVLVDTAGIASTADMIERLGIERSRAALAGADLVLFVVDASEPLTPADGEIASLVGARPAIVVLNKSDLRRVDAEGVLPAAPRVALSALTGMGLSDLETAIADLVLAGRVLASDEPVLSNPRHRDVLQRARDHLRTAQDAHTHGLAADLITIDLTAAVNALGEITGETATEDLLEAIFSNFCVGK